MKLPLLWFCLLQIPLYGSEDENYQFFLEQSKNLENNYRINRYEKIISGGLGFLIGNIGYFSSDSKALKIGYSAVQTVGIINVGRGVYDFYSPQQEREFHQLLKTYSKDKNKNPQFFLADELVRIFGQEERAKRLSLMATSSLLAGQYFINAFVDTSDSTLKNVYLFMGSVNTIIIGYTLFFKNKYELQYEKSQRSSVSFSPFPIEKGGGVVAQISY